MTDAGRARRRPHKRGSYFVLSYAHSAPLEGEPPGDPDQYERRFFNHLARAVGSHAPPHSGLAAGFFDQKIPVASDWKKSFSRALGAAEVFVPLYSPRYFARSWPGREWACFHERLVRAGLEDPAQRFAPVLWTPLWEQEDPPGFHAALAIGKSEPEYARSGLRALLTIPAYRPSYKTVVDQLAQRIVTLAAQSRLEPSAVPDIDTVKSRFHPDARLAVFQVSVAAPTIRSVPVGRDPRPYGDTGIQWRPFPPQEVPLAEYARRIAERLDFRVELIGVGDSGEPAPSKPGIVLIDPWFIASEAGLRALRSAVHDLPRWVLPLLVLSPPTDRATGELAQRVRDILSATEILPAESSHRAPRSVSSLKDFVAIVPMLVAEAERRYLRRTRVPVPLEPPPERPRLSDAPPDTYSPLRPVREEPDA
ncbi:MAG TPA: TIR-like protein FxsC [Streptosporangiaceae bacterium]|nr:TIR-like protein FxsC [Streptosporangiaceae bacterium]